MSGVTQSQIFEHARVHSHQKTPLASHLKGEFNEVHKAGDPLAGARPFLGL
jgi:hypothetical protein